MGKNSEDAAEILRKYARYILENAEQLVGDLDTVYVSDGIDVSFRLSKYEAPTIHVAKSFFAIDRKPRCAGNDR